jgi:hypothetical protein
MRQETPLAACARLQYKHVKLVWGHQSQFIAKCDAGQAGCCAVGAMGLIWAPGCLVLVWANEPYLAKIMICSSPPASRRFV